MNIRDNHRDFFLLVYPIIKLIVRNTSSVSWHIIRAGFVLVDTPTWNAFGAAILQGQRLGLVGQSCSATQAGRDPRRASHPVPAKAWPASVISGLWMQT